MSYLTKRPSCAFNLILVRDFLEESLVERNERYKETRERVRIAIMSNARDGTGYARFSDLGLDVYDFLLDHMMIDDDRDLSIEDIFQLLCTVRYTFHIFGANVAGISPSLNSSLRPHFQSLKPNSFKTTLFF